METVFVVIRKEKLHLYSKDDGRYSIQYINGNPYFEYEIDSLEKDIDELLSILVDEYNLEDAKELQFEILQNEDRTYSGGVEKALSEFVCKIIEPAVLVKNAMEQLSKDASLRINEFGVNYGGFNYKLKKNQVVKEEFDILAFTISEQELLEFIV